MGLLNKLKNALFEEEEIEIDPTPEKVVIKDEEPLEKKKEIKTEELPLENDRELFKAENTFNFPDFDEEEFEINYETEKKVVPPKVEKRKEPKPVKKENTYFESKVKVSRETHSRREKNKPQEEPVKKFIPSPIISPVYGVLDKNYKKDDVIVKESSVLPKKTKIDVDMVRKKAFGTLEDDIEKTMSESVEDFYNKETKSIDDLLNESIDDTIEINYTEEQNFEETLSLDPKDLTDNHKFANNIEEELDKVDENLEDIEENPKVEEKNEDYLENNTLENDLFDLIDSMYENKEEE